MPRSYNRQADQLRPVEIIRGYTDNAPGSVLVSFGRTKVLVTATIEERVPRHLLAFEGHGWVTAEYSMLPGSSSGNRVQRDRNKISGRTQEIQRLIGRCLRTSVDLKNLGQRTIHIDADVIQADGGTRVASITGAYIALVDALFAVQEKERERKPGKLWPLPLFSPVAAVSVGMKDGVALLDLDYTEDSSADVDANIVMNGDGELIEVQFTSEESPFNRTQLNTMLDLGQAGIQQLLDLQRECLKEPFAGFPRNSAERQSALV